LIKDPHWPQPIAGFFVPAKGAKKMEVTDLTRKTKFKFKPRPTPEDRNIDLREVCMIRGRSRSSTLRDVENGLIPKPFKIGLKTYWRLSWILEANDRAVKNAA